MLVYPIKDLDDIQAMKSALRAENPRDELLFTFGINTALRISDLLALTIGHVVESPGTLAVAVTIQEKKTGKSKTFPLNQAIRKPLIAYLKTRPGALPGEPLFLSSREKGFLGRRHALRILKSAAERIGLKTNVGTHTMRKTFGYFMYQKYKDIVKVMKLLNHSSPKETMRYIGIDQEELDEAYLDFNL